MIEEDDDDDVIDLSYQDDEPAPAAADCAHMRRSRPAPSEAAIIPPPEEQAPVDGRRCPGAVPPKLDIVVKLPSMLKPRQISPRRRPRNWANITCRRGIAWPKPSTATPRAQEAIRPRAGGDPRAGAARIQHRCPGRRDRHRPGHHDVRDQPGAGHQGVGDHRADQRHHALAQGRERAHRRAGPGQEHRRHRSAQRAEGKGPPQGADAARPRRRCRR